MSLLLRIAACALLGAASPSPVEAGGSPVAPAPAQSADLAKPSSDCGDFLSEAGMRPEHLDFVSCESLSVYGAAALRAHYRVAGEHAAAIESFLAKRTQMPRLRYLCCGWESAPKHPGRQPLAGRIVFSGAHYEVSMTSGETSTNSRSQWREIPEFHVYVLRYVDEP